MYQRVTTNAESIARQLNNYIAYLKRSKQGEKDFPSGYTVRDEPEIYIADEFQDSDH